MRRGLFILLLGLAVGAVSYCCVFLSGTAATRTLEQSQKPELAWLREEFKLSDAEFQRISELHAQYLPRCREMCIQIDAQNVQLQKLLSGATNITPDIERALSEASRLRTECQTMMLGHFLQVSQTMPPEEGRRYLAWVTEKTFLPNYDMR